MSDYGILTDFWTGKPIRPATAAEWRQCADALISRAAATGLFSLAGRDVFVEGGPVAEVSDDNIRTLRVKAGAAGDYDQVELCSRAINDADGDARGECARVILDNRQES